MRCLAATVYCSVVGVAFAQSAAVDFDVTGEFTGAFTGTALYDTRAPDLLERQSRDIGFTSTGLSGSGYQLGLSSNRLMFIDQLGIGAQRTNTAAFSFESSASIDNTAPASLLSAQSLNQGSMRFRVQEPVIVSIQVDWSGQEQSFSAQSIASAQFSVFAFGASDVTIDTIEFSGSGEQSASWDLVFDDVGLIGETFDLSFIASAAVIPGVNGTAGDASSSLDITVDVRAIPLPGTTLLLAPGIVVSARRRR